MIKLIISMIVAMGLTLGGATSFVWAEQYQQQTSQKQITTIKGEVISVQSDTLTIQGQQGELHSFKVSDSQKLQQLKQGDKVEIAVETKQRQQTKQQQQSQQQQQQQQQQQTKQQLSPQRMQLAEEISIEGEVVSAQNNTLQIRDSGNRNQTLKVTGVKDMQGLQSGDKVNVTLGPISSMPLIQTTAEVTQSTQDTLQLKDRQGNTYIMQGLKAESLEELRSGNKVGITVKKAESGS